MCESQFDELCGYEKLPFHEWLCMFVCVCLHVYNFIYLYIYLGLGKCNEFSSDIYSCSLLLKLMSSKGVPRKETDIFRDILDAL